MAYKLMLNNSIMLLCYNLISVGDFVTHKNNWIIDKKE